MCIKLLILGYKGAGKSTLVKSHNGQLTGTADEYTVDFQTTENGRIQFLCSESQVLDITNTWKYGTFMILFDLSNKFSYTHAQKICEMLSRKCSSDKRPIVLVGNKLDIRNRQVRDIAIDREFGHPVYLISARDKVDNDRPFISLARSLMKVPSLTFVDDVPKTSPKAPSPERVSSVLEQAPLETCKQLTKLTYASSHLVQTNSVRKQPAKNSLGESVAGSPSLAALGL
ncbi:hypothetical protein MKW94_002783, partial [Papaver nudicaule]|nr:hypothetical protein [Papaver nudicaule]